MLGVMSGTSLDGIDLAVLEFELNEKWSYKMRAAETFLYSVYWEQSLKNALNLNDLQLKELNLEYTKYLAAAILNFKKMHPLDCADLDAVCSHGHTIKHEPQNKHTLQIGNLPELSKLINEVVVCDFRVQDVELGGQGAPLVPIGDELLFTEFDYCLNLGGFANISTRQDEKRIAYDVCAVNTVLNFYAEKLGHKYDDAGQIASRGSFNEELFHELSRIGFYQQNAPKSLGIEWVQKEIFPILKKYEVDAPSVMHTYVHHIAAEIAKQVKVKKNAKVLVTGGGAFNDFLIQKLKEKTDAEIILPSKNIIEYKEALIFGFLGVLRFRNEVNVLQSVTGAVKNHSSGKVFFRTNNTLF